MNKKRLREYYLKKRSEIKNSDKELKIVENFINAPFYQQAKTVFVTVPVRDEIDTSPIIKASLANNKRVFLPRSVPKTRTMELVEIFDYPGSLKVGAYGIPEPQEEADMNVKPDLTVVPGLAFSLDGYRLGYGGGYYDRFLQDFKTFSVGLSYNELILPSLPIDKFDQPIDALITPDYLVQTNRNQSQFRF